jgi:glycine/sarcosine N-methyltransferase
MPKYHDEACDRPVRVAHAIANRSVIPGRLADYVLMAGAYEMLAADYDWMFGDDELANGRAINRAATARLLQRISGASAVLDAACGTGVDAAVLARRGFRVQAADGSEAMTGAAAARFAREGLAIPVVRSNWADLPAAIGERFDVVLCAGNSLVHAAGRDAMVQALTGLRRMARPGGYVVVDSRNWEKLHAERQIVQVASRAVTRAGRRCVVLYAWEIPDRLGDQHIAHLTFIFDNDGQLESHEYPITFRPFTVSELRERLELAGLKEVDADFDPSRDRYSIVTATT